MFKKISILFVAVMAVFVMASGAKAAPVYYTFTGTIYSNYDAAGAVAAAGLSNGSEVSYTYLVDRALDGTYTLYNGTTYTKADSSTVDYYYTELVSAKPIVNQNGGYAPYMTATHIEQLNYGYEYLNSGLNTNYNELRGGSYLEHSFVRNLNQSPFQSMASWTVGTTGFNAKSQAFNSNGLSSYINSNLTLTGISSTNPLTSAVPEPSTLLLLGSGLVGLGYVRRRFKA